MTAIPELVALRVQLAVVAGSEPSSSFLEVRPLDAGGRPELRQRAFIPVRELDQAAQRCLELAGHLNVYVGVAPRVTEDGTAAAVERVWTLWADLDGPDALARLREFRPLPSIVIRSGSDDSAHAYWPLCEPIPPHWAQRANRRLAIALGADMHATDPARILRACGTLNHKHDPPRPVVCTRLELDVFTFDQIAGLLPDDRSYTLPISEPRARVGNRAKSVQGLARTVREARVGARNASLFWAACRIADEAGQLDVADAREQLRDAAIAAGLDEFEIDHTLRSALDTVVAA